MGDVVQEIARGSRSVRECGAQQGTWSAWEPRLRAEAAYVGRELGGISLTQAAQYLGRDLSTMSLALTRLENELGSDGEKRKRLDSLCVRLRQGRRRKYQISKA